MSKIYEGERFKGEIKFRDRRLPNFGRGEVVLVRVDGVVVHVSPTWIDRNRRCACGPVVADAPQTADAPATTFGDCHECGRDARLHDGICGECRRLTRPLTGRRVGYVGLGGPYRRRTNGN